jgi:hypothetical protein
VNNAIQQTNLRHSSGSEINVVVSRNYGTLSRSRRLQSKSSKTCAPTTSAPTKSLSPSGRPTSQPTSTPTSNPTVSPTSIPTITFQPTRSKSGKPSRPPASKQPSTNSPTKARSIRCLYPSRSAKFPKVCPVTPVHNNMLYLVGIEIQRLSDKFLWGVINSAGAAGE